MISRRNLITMILMMGVLFVLLLFPIILRDSQNHYGFNSSTYDGKLTAESAWQPAVHTDDTLPDRAYAVYIGGTDQAVYDTVLAWCTYRKMDLACYERPADYVPDASCEPVLVCVDGAHLDPVGDVAALTAIRDGGTAPLVFLTIPAANTIARSWDFMELLGISAISEPAEPVVGIQVFSGFLLGGQRFYSTSARSTGDPGMMDLDLHLVSYRVCNGAKVYVAGMFAETPEETETQPPLVWRYATTENQVYVFYGNFLKDESGAGCLDAVMAESRPYDLYPVVNAQVFSVVNYPSFAADNAAAMQEVYDRSQDSFYEEVVWPDMLALMMDSGFQGTYFLTAQLDYGQQGSVSEEVLDYYLRQFNEQDCEAGISLKTRHAVWLQAKLDADVHLLHKAVDYTYSAFYAPHEMLGVLPEYARETLFESIRTVVTDSTAGYRLVDYLTDRVTLQGVTCDVAHYADSDDLRQKGYEMALGYVNLLFDATQVSYPVAGEREWSYVEQELSSVVGTYWQDYASFDRVTASEADRRIRNFLALDYTQERQGEKLRLHVDGLDDDAYFLLRLHAEKITDAQGATDQEIEEGIYLLHVTQPEVEITLQTVGQQVHIRK